MKRGDGDAHGSKMHLLIDALSVNNLSGRHVLLGHLRQLVAGLGADCRFSLLTHRDNRDIAGELPAGVEHVLADVDGRWLPRLRWSSLRLRRLCADIEVDLVLNPSGMLSRGCAVPQAVLAQNPWPLTGMARGVDAFKSYLQRVGFRRAQRGATLMAFNSDHMRERYEQSFGAPLNPAVVAYQGIAESRFRAPAAVLPAGARRAVVLSVSVMARHKAIEVLVAAFAQVAARVADAQLVLAGSWPDARYRAEIDTLIHRVGLASRVKIHGHVSEPELQALYAESRVFCLLSRCESFGIPAVEAQAAGTPCVVATGTAAPEVTGGGALVVAQDDPAAAACALLTLIEDDDEWARRSAAARSNAERFHWDICSRPLVAAIGRLVAVMRPSPRPGQAA
jgi:glycosyltransferase involved in cell wall biosynthesis